MAIVFVFNSGTGSDTAASGAGPGDGIISGSAISGTNASFSGSVVTLDGSPDLSAFTTDWVLFLDTTTGRKFFSLSAADNGAKTVTCNNAPAGTATGLTWVIGGKRATWDHATSRLLWGTTNSINRATFATETDQTLSSSIAVNDGTYPTYCWKGIGTKPTITFTANGRGFDNATGTFKLKNLKLVNSNATKTNAYCLHNAQAGMVAEDCIIGDSTNFWNRGVNITNTSSHTHLIDCTIDSCSGIGFYYAGSSGLLQTVITGCVIKLCGSGGVSAGASSGEFHIIDSIIAGNTGDGINVVNGSPTFIQNCTIHGNSGDGIDITQPIYLTVLGCNITGNGNYGIRSNSAALHSICADYNNFGTGGTANTSGARSNVEAGDNDIAVDPGYANAASYNFSVGVNVKALGFPMGSRYVGGNSTGTRSYKDIGASQREEAAVAGGGGPSRPPINGALIS